MPLQSTASEAPKTQSIVHDKTKTDHVMLSTQGQRYTQSWRSLAQDTPAWLASTVGLLHKCIQMSTCHLKLNLCMLKITDMIWYNCHYYFVGGPPCTLRIVSATILQFSSLPPEIQKKSVATVADAHTNAPVCSKVPDGNAQFSASDGSRIIKEWSRNEADNEWWRSEKQSVYCKQFSSYVQLIPLGLK